MTLYNENIPLQYDMHEALTKLSLDRKFVIEYKIENEIENEGAYRDNNDSYIFTASTRKCYDVFFPHYFSVIDKASEVAKIFEVAVNLHIEPVVKDAVEDNITSALSHYEGITVLKSFVLMFGYPAENVLSLSTDEVSSALSTLDVVGVQLPWDTLLSFVHSDIDRSLVENLIYGK